MSRGGRGVAVGTNASHVAVGIDWDRQPLGKMTDNALARRLGVAQATVWKARTQREIAKFGAEQEIDIDAREQQSASYHRWRDVMRCL